MQPGTLIFFCGKMGAGKSTRSQEIAGERNAVLLSEDAWLAGLYPTEITSFEDYLRYSARLKPLIRALVIDILSKGTDVVMDFPANTVRQRKWFKKLVDETRVPHELVYLKVSDEVCLQRIAKRGIEQPERAAFDTEETFRQVTAFFEEPSAEEGFNIQ